MEAWSCRLIDLLDPNSGRGTDIDAACDFLCDLPLTSCLKAALVNSLHCGEALQNEVLHTFYVREETRPLPPRYQQLCAAPVAVSVGVSHLRWGGGVGYKPNSRPAWSFKEVPKTSSLVGQMSHERVRQAFLFYDSQGTGRIQRAELLRKLWASLQGKAIDQIPATQEELRDLLDHGGPGSGGFIDVEAFLERF